MADDEVLEVVERIVAADLERVRKLRSNLLKLGIIEERVITDPDEESSDVPAHEDGAR